MYNIPFSFLCARAIGRIVKGSMMMAESLSAASVVAGKHSSYSDI